jgi:hypothetical protein
MSEKKTKKLFDSYFDLSDNIEVNEAIHYPENDFIDSNSGSQCFFHRHKSKTIGTTQHFHFFRNWVPPVKELEGNIMCTHIAALEVNDYFDPISWFSINQWVTGNYFLLANDLRLLCKNFNFDAIKNNLNKEILLWLEHTFENGAKNYFDDLILERDRNLEFIYNNGVTNILKNEDYEVISRILISRK